MNNKITSAEFVKGIVGQDELLSSEALQVAFIGRSNVGKSTLLNTLLQRKDLVKTSAKPGKTKEINYFNINKTFYFADLPGYGFATASREDREKLRQLILWYLLDTKIANRKTVLILDSRVGVSATDMEILKALREAGQEVIIVANKVDKLSQSERHHALKDILEITQNHEVIPFSSETGEGKDALMNKIIE